MVETRTEAEMVAGVRAHLLESIRLRLRADVPVGIYLSGGIDSSVIAGMVTHLVNEQGERIGSEKERERVSCFSIGFDEDSGYDESCELSCLFHRHPSLVTPSPILSHLKTYRTTPRRQILQKDDE